MSSKIEVIVPEHRADNSTWLRTWEEFCEDLFLCVSPERRGGHQWLKEQRHKQGKYRLTGIIYILQLTNYNKSHFNIWEITEVSDNFHFFLFQSWPPSVFLSLGFFLSVTSQALTGTSLPLIIWRLIAYPYLARRSWFNDESTIQPSKLPSPPLNFDSIGLSNFPVNAWNVFLHTFLLVKLHRGIMRMR